MYTKPSSTQTTIIIFDPTVKTAELLVNPLIQVKWFELLPPPGLFPLFISWLFPQLKESLE